MKTKFIKSFLFILLSFVAFGVPLQAQNDGPDSGLEPVEFREFDKEKIERYRGDEDFEYTPPQLQEKGPFQRFIEKISTWFMKLLGSGAAGTLWDIVWRLTLVVVFILFIIKIFGIEAQSIFKPSKKKVMAYTVDEESLDQINFDEEIPKALQNGQWRLAIRLIYLSALKHLADTERVVVIKGKTNHEYLYELDPNETKDNFSNLSFLFDYTWYGHFEASESMTDKAQLYLKEIVKRGGQAS